MFINISNHPSEKWSDKQVSEARKYGNILDIPFPIVASNSTSEEIYDIARKLICKVLEYNPSAVLCQGEFTLTYALVQMMKEKNIKVLAATSERCVVEKTLEDGTVSKNIKFEFVQFREY